MGSEVSFGCFGFKVYRWYFRYENWNGIGNIEVVEEVDDDYCCVYSFGRLLVCLYVELFLIGDVLVSWVSVEVFCNFYGGLGYVVEEEIDEDYFVMFILRDCILGDYVGEYIWGDVDDVNYKWVLCRYISYG